MPRPRRDAKMYYLLYAWMSDGHTVERFKKSLEGRALRGETFTIEPKKKLMQVEGSLLPDKTCPSFQASSK